MAAAVLASCNDSESGNVSTPEISGYIAEVNV